MSGFRREREEAGFYQCYNIITIHYVKHYNTLYYDIIILLSLIWNYGAANLAFLVVYLAFYTILNGKAFKTRSQNRF